MGCGKQRELPHLSIPSKTAACVPEFEVEDVPLNRTAVLVPQFSVNDVPLDRILDDDDDDDDIINMDSNLFTYYSL